MVALRVCTPCRTVFALYKRWRTALPCAPFSCWLRPQRFMASLPRVPTPPACLVRYSRPTTATRRGLCARPSPCGTPVLLELFALHFGVQDLATFLPSFGALDYLPHRPRPHAYVPTCYVRLALDAGALQAPEGPHRPRPAQWTLHMDTIDLEVFFGWILRHRRPA